MHALIHATDILYIEDNEADIESLRDIFKKINDLLNIVTVKSGTEALDKLYGRHGHEKITTPKLILINISLSKDASIEFLKSLRADPEFSTPPVYVLTASFTTEDKLALHDLNIAGHIVKPLEYSDALNLFWSLLNEQEE
jgi:CheY-like chemotaxis protein